ncbi:MAG: multidrug efflux system membrane fusion protein [Halieaceae bacterium]|jgi:multidrug efflux system membrane fusion protein
MRPVIILAGLAFCSFLLIEFAPETQRKAPERSARMTVDTLFLEETSFAVEVESYGTVKPRTQSLLVAQVGGQVTRIMPNFREGGFFRRGDVLVEIDPRDYQANVKVAEAGVLDARQKLQEENARSEQAAKDWKRLGKGASPSDLVLRKPQLLAVEAQLISGSANLDKALLELERTRITALFDGRVLRKSVDLGQVVSRNAQVGEIFATDAVEIRLPIRNHDLAFVDLPERYADSDTATPGPVVEISSNLLAGQRWRGEIVRTESAIDEAARQLHVVAQLDDPFSVKTPGIAPIKIGQYVSARISGKSLTDVIVIPINSIYQGSYVYVVEGEALYRRDIEIAWQNDDQAVVASGLVGGDQLIITPLGQVISGTPVRVGNADTELTSTRIVAAKADG